MTPTEREALVAELRRLYMCRWNSEPLSVIFSRAQAAADALEAMGAELESAQRCHLIVEKLYHEAQAERDSLRAALEAERKEVDRLSSYLLREEKDCLNAISERDELRLQVEALSRSLQDARRNIRERIDAAMGEPK